YIIIEARLPQRSAAGVIDFRADQSQMLLRRWAVQIAWPYFKIQLLLCTVRTCEHNTRHTSIDTCNRALCGFNPGSVTHEQEAHILCLHGDSKESRDVPWAGGAAQESVFSKVRERKFLAVARKNGHGA